MQGRCVLITDIPKARAVRSAIADLAPRDANGNLENPYRHWTALLDYAIEKHESAHEDHPVVRGRCTHA